MKVGRIIAVLVASVLLSSAIWSQDSSKQPNFSGRWVLEKINEYPGHMGVGNLGGAKMESELIVSHTDKELRVKETTKTRESFLRETLYYTDGRGETNKGFTLPFPYVSKTTLNNGRLLIDTKIQHSRGEASLVEEWELSPDGKTLTVRILATPSSNGPRPVRSPAKYDKVFKLTN
jgi:hypothetical protein